MRGKWTVISLHGVLNEHVCGFLQVVVAICLWGTDVSRAYVFQASGPAEGGDNPPPHTKGDMFDHNRSE